VSHETQASRSDRGGGGVRAIVLTPAGAVAAKGKSSCSVKDLHYSYTKGTAFYSDAVERLTTTAASCTSAQKVAGTVAKNLLHKTKLPGTVDGLKVKVTNPCAGCTPLWSATATGGGATVTFTVMGGAK
jgi:hypothetical protein